MAGVLWLSEIQGPEGNEGGWCVCVCVWCVCACGCVCVCVWWVGGYVALLHQRVCSNAIAGLRHTKKTRLLEYSHLWSPGVCSNYRTKPGLNQALSTEVLYSLQLACASLQMCLDWRNFSLQVKASTLPYKMWQKVNAIWDPGAQNQS